MLPVRGHECVPLITLIPGSEIITELRHPIISDAVVGIQVVR